MAYFAALIVLPAARALEPALAAAGLAAGAAFLLVAWRRRQGLGLAAALIVIAASAATWVAAGRISSMPTRWTEIADRQVQRGVEDLRVAVRQARERARAAVEEFTAATSPDRGWPDGPSSQESRPALFRALADARSGRADALFVLGPTGELLAWTGRHQGPLPETVQTATGDLAFAEGPLFDYLYVIGAAPGGARVVAAVLLETDPALADRELPSVASAVRERTGARPRFGAGPGPPGAPWRLGPAGAEVVHAVLEVAPPAQWRAAAIQRAQVLSVALAALVLALALIAWLRAGPPQGLAARAGPALALGLALAVAPRPGGHPGSIFNPAMFFIAVGDGVTLWGVLALALTVAVLSAVYGGVRDRPGAALAAALAVAAAFAAGTWLVGQSTSDELFRAGGPLWWGLQVPTCALLAAVAAAVLPRPRAGAPKEGGAGLWLTAGLILGATLGIGVVLARRPWEGPEPALALAWVAPAYLVARATRSFRPGGLRRWLAAVALAGTALLPQLWLGAEAARVRGAAEDVDRLATADDPYLDFVMRRFAIEVRQRRERGEDGAALLYRAWVGSGLAAEGYPVRMALWTPDGSVAERLDVTDYQADPEAGAHVIADLVASARESDATVALSAPTAAVRHARAVPLGAGWTASALVLPRRSLAAEGLAAAALAARPVSPSAPVLTLTESTTAAAVDGIIWARSAAGVRGEGEVRLGERLYHAHVEIDLDPPLVRAARGVLLLVVDLAALALLWALAHALAGSVGPPLAPWLPAPGSFRSRVTLALFLFFLAPTLAFGAVAYRALAGTAEREAEAVVVRASAQATEVFAAAGGNLQAVASLVGLDVLRYVDGELYTSSRPELVGLGVHDAWLPPAAHLALEQREALALDRGGRLLGRRAVAAFRRLPPAGVLGVLALPGGAAATRREELTDMLVFAVLVGAVLSLALSLVAGRALARPIGELSRASSAVGAGRLRVRLPADRRDEFGDLYRSINRMTRRLRRARARELRSARVLAWGEMARQVAHEIKNPLTPIRLSVQHVRRAYRDGRDDFEEILEGNVEQVLHEIDRLSEIARAFARYGGPAESGPALEPVAVAAVARDVQALYASGDRGLTVRVHSEGDAPPAAARDAELREVLVNLFENARAALPDDGAVDVRVRAEDGGVTLEVTDAGEGIPADVLPSVFDPHFSTRSSGTGLGLAIVKRLVEDWGGRISAESEPGRGTTFRVWLREHGGGAREEE